MLSNVKKVDRVRDLVQSKSGEHLDLTSTQFIEESPQTERIARNSFLVLAVTAYEDYIKDALYAFLVRNWKPDKTYQLRFKPEDLPPASNMHDWLKERTVQVIVDEHLGKRYDSRITAVSKLVVEYGARQPALPLATQALAATACEFRNNIVHSSGVADARAVAALQAVISGIKVGDTINMSEALLWQFLGALRDSARALDVQLRVLPR
ncbi:hypothetical protein OYC61_011560 [Alcaligenes nematophilus]|uniref:RiboL-PSP-HEPN domain-containing protein n=1 Tax=Alcaligenes nematophilus TaxID=2994643 RepID=A0ABU3MTG2_9BURK|nr:hypothetical protein [Alcaligenes nematophilus]MDT8470530.1 hypothetical protein [Alcaligenes nematophilus]MDT8504932.1 hypothetical protein [Alcaligenes nematophilus]MDT8526918.1 hypothetical protein [Alcaligenes nematophilus]